MSNHAWLIGPLGALALLGSALAIGCGGAQGGAGDQSLAKAKQSSPEGARVFARECAGCHGKRGEGAGKAPATMGAGALAKTGHDRPAFSTARDVFDYVKASMPRPKPKAGSLSDGEYWAVVAYMLEANGKPLPDGGLSPDNAASVRIHD